MKTYYNKKILLYFGCRATIIIIKDFFPLEKVSDTCVCLCVHFLSNFESYCSITIYTFPHLVFPPSAWSDDSLLNIISASQRKLIAVNVQHVNTSEFLIS
jgi:hypothetical protein